MAYQSAINSKTVAEVRSESPDAIGLVFNRTLFIASQNSDVFSKFEGPDLPDGGVRKVADVTGSTETGYPVVRCTNLAKAKGQKVIFTVMSQLGGFGKVGEDRLRGSEEKTRRGTYEVMVDMIRHGVAETELVDQFLATGGTREEAAALLLGDWLGRKKQDHSLWSLRQYAQSRNTYINGGRSNVDKLLSTDTFGTSTISEAAALAFNNGCKPTKVMANKAGATVQKLLFFGSDTTLRPLKNNALYMSALTQAGAQIGRDGENNPLWDGGFCPWDGHGIFHWIVQDPDAVGAEGARCEPRGHLGTPITANANGNAPLSITFGGVAAPDSVAPYAQYFPGYEYKMYQSQAALADTGAYFLLIYNHQESSDGAGDQGKFGIYKYVGSANDGNKIAISERLAATTAGTYNKAVVGEVAWDANLHTVNHPTGAPIVLVNAKGVPYAWSYGLGANALLRAYGSLPVDGKFVNGDDDYGMDQGAAVKSIFGTNVARDTQGLPRNYVKIASAIQPFGMRLPSITA